jgi:hypothetical protein
MQSFKSAIFPAVSGFRAARPNLTSRTAGQTPDDILEVVVDRKLATGPPLRGLKAPPLRRSRSLSSSALAASKCYGLYRLSLLHNAVTKVIVLTGYFRAPIGYFWLAATSPETRYLLDESPRDGCTAFLPRGSHKI